MRASQLPAQGRRPGSVVQAVHLLTASAAASSSPLSALAAAMCPYARYSDSRSPCLAVERDRRARQPRARLAPETWMRQLVTRQQQPGFERRRLAASTLRSARSQWCKPSSPKPTRLHSHALAPATRREFAGVRVLRQSSAAAGCRCRAGSAGAATARARSRVARLHASNSLAWPEHVGASGPSVSPPRAVFQRIGSRALQQSVARRLAGLHHQQRLSTSVPRCSSTAHSSSVSSPASAARGQIEAAGKHARRAGTPTFLGHEQPMTPCEHLVQRLVAPGRGPCTGGQQPKAFVKAFAHAGHAQQGHACGGQFDRQRQTIEPAADVDHVGDVVLRSAQSRAAVRPRGRRTARRPRPGRGASLLPSGTTACGAITDARGTAQQLLAGRQHAHAPAHARAATAQKRLAASTRCSQCRAPAAACVLQRSITSSLGLRPASVGARGLRDRSGQHIRSTTGASSDQPHAVGEAGVRRCATACAIRFLPMPPAPTMLTSGLRLAPVRPRLRCPARADQRGNCAGRFVAEGSGPVLGDGDLDGCRRRHRDASSASVNRIAAARDGRDGRPARAACAASRLEPAGCSLRHQAWPHRVRATRSCRRRRSCDRSA